MSASAQIQSQVDAAVQAALAPVLKELAELKQRVSELEAPAQTAPAKKAPAKKAVAAHAQTAQAKAEAQPK